MKYFKLFLLLFLINTAHAEMVLIGLDLRDTFQESLSRFALQNESDKEVVAGIADFVWRCDSITEAMEVKDQIQYQLRRYNIEHVIGIAHITNEIESNGLDQLRIAMKSANKTGLLTLVKQCERLAMK